MEAGYSSEKFVSTYESTRDYNPGNQHGQSLVFFFPLKKNLIARDVEEVLLQNGSKVRTH
jgi:hypothetical protein